jgi:hypothetical protein
LASEDRVPGSVTVSAGWTKCQLHQLFSYRFDFPLIVIPLPLLRTYQLEVCETTYIRRRHKVLHVSVNQMDF